MDVLWDGNFDFFDGKFKKLKLVHSIEIEDSNFSKEISSAHLLQDVPRVTKSYKFISFFRIKYFEWDTNFSLIVCLSRCCKLINVLDLWCLSWNFKILKQVWLIWNINILIYFEIETWQIIWSPCHDLHFIIHISWQYQISKNILYYLTL